MKFKIKLQEKELEIEILEKENEIFVKVGEKAFSFPQTKTFSTSLSFFPEKKKKIEILAPISGTVSAIFKKEGEVVKRGEKILTLLAMKMENEICSPKEGKIKKIFVHKGETVKKDQKLVEVE